MKSYIALVVLVICVTSSYAIQWKDCGSKLSKVKNVLVTGCESSKVCDLPKGQNVTFTVDFITNADVEDAKSVVHGVIDRIPLPFPIPHSDACTDPSAGIKCPLKKNTSYTFHPYIYVSRSYPQVKVIVKWELQNKAGDDIFCVMVAAQVTEAKAKDQNRTKPKYSNKTPKLFQLL